MEIIDLNNRHPFVGDMFALTILGLLIMLGSFGHRWF